ncbi:unnamed protein product [Orchesella dallaii]|uniref:Uncharacterized protein n=1 Tax=Orchesella dallaii TaxID=48710 RepID=A0ABP1PZA6_9HEXA
MNDVTSDQEQEESRHSSSTNIVSKTQSTVSVPSLYDAIQTYNKNGSQQQLAFTTEELELNPNDATRTSSGSGKSWKSPSRYGNRHSGRITSDGMVDPTMNNLTAISTVPTSVVSQINREFGQGNNPIPLRAKPTVTTILRHHHALQRVEKKSRDKLDSLLISNLSLVDPETLVKEQEKKQAEEIKAAEAKRLVQAKLAYERAIAASRKVADKKQRIADETRMKEREWQTCVTEQREADKVRRKQMTETLVKANEDSKRAFEQMLLSKHEKAMKVRQETEQLQADAKQKQKEEDQKRQDRIQQIQAQKLALRRTKVTTGNPNQFYRSIAIPETQIKLRLQKEEEERRIQEQRRKIQAAKQLKSVKLIKAMKKIQSHEHISQFGKSQSRGIKTAQEVSPETMSLKTTKNGEIHGMLQELETLRNENNKLRNKEQQRRGQSLVPAPSFSLTKVGARTSTIPKGYPNFLRPNPFGILSIGKH